MTRIELISPADGSVTEPLQKHHWPIDKEWVDLETAGDKASVSSFDWQDLTTVAQQFSFWLSSPVIGGVVARHGTSRRQMGPGSEAYRGPITGHSAAVECFVVRDSVISGLRW